MKIVVLTDIHGRLDALGPFGPALADADLALLSGDLTQFGGAEAARAVVEKVRTCGPDLMAVPGNCDRPGVASYLREEGIALDARHVILEGVAFAGLGGSLPCPGRTPNELSEEELADALSGSVIGLEPGLPLVLVSHQPPLNTVSDIVRGGIHVGSSAVRSFIEEHEPLVCFTGHIHEAAGIDRIGTTPIINPGPAHMGGYAYAEIDGGELKTADIRSAR
jgi:Icc-related predicted phosphoesterase